MLFDPERQHRRSIRLRGYDYTQAGAYFVTMVIQDRSCLFGGVVDGHMRLNEAGRMVAAEWDALCTRFINIDLDAFVVMPNHIHGIIVITDAQSGATTRVAPTPVPVTTTRDRAVGHIVGAFKSLTTVAYARGVTTQGWSPFRGRLWQRNYFEHIVRNEEVFYRIRQYIADNPARGTDDPENPQGIVGAVSCGRPNAEHLFRRPGANSHSGDPGHSHGEGHPRGVPLQGDESP
ncbi:MAG: transposase [Pseudomonadota bacterium]|nr:transposase [Pseudomonadota bacterium]